MAWCYLIRKSYNPFWMKMIVTCFPPNVIVRRSPSAIVPCRTISIPLVRGVQRGGDTDTSNCYIRSTIPTAPQRTTSFVSSTTSRRMSTSATAVETGVENDSAVITDTVNTQEVVDDSNAEHKLRLLRSLMKERNIDVYLIPSDDPHLSGTTATFVYGYVSLDL
jgi:hypothetical protein